jgi:hypothetical protein
MVKLLNLQLQQRVDGELLQLKQITNTTELHWNWSIDIFFFGIQKRGYPLQPKRWLCNLSLVIGL